MTTGLSVGMILFLGKICDHFGGFFIERRDLYGVGIYIWDVDIKLACIFVCLLFSIICFKFPQFYLFFSAFAGCAPALLPPQSIGPVYAWSADLLKSPVCEFANRLQNIQKASGPLI